MADTPTIINNSKEIYELIDTAIKIGLGALISGIATYFVTRSSQKHDISQKKFDQKMTLILDSNAAFTNYTKTVMEILDFHYSASTQNISSINDLNDEDQIEFKKIEKNYINSLSNHDDLKNKLNLLGLKQSLEYINKYQSLFTNFRKSFIEKKQVFFDEEEITDLTEKLHNFEDNYNNSMYTYFENLK